MNQHQTSDNLRHITPEGLAMLGMPSLAYVRPVEVSGGTGWGIFSASGQAMGVVDDRELALAAARQHELEPVDVH